MSDLAYVGGAQGDGTGTATPRALIHKKILETAAARPDATMAGIADDVSGASTDLVERVLAEYGDPAEPVDSGDEPAPSSGDATAGDESTTADGAVEPTDTASPAAGAAAGADTAESEQATDRSSRPGEHRTDERMTDDSTAVEPPEVPSENRPSEKQRTAEEPSEKQRTAEESVEAELSEKELAVLKAVAERPNATQQELADLLGVSRATISKRASGIDGFEWQRRVAFVERFFDDADVSAPGVAESTAGASGGQTTDAADTGSSSGGETPRFEEISTRLDAIDDRLSRLESRQVASDGGSGLTDPRLAHKVLHACIESDAVSEEEELQIVSAVLSDDVDI